MMANNNIPMYERIVQDLKRRVTRGELQPGDRLPTLAEMCVHYDVSRITVDRVVKELKDERVVETFRGKGTFLVGVPEVDVQQDRQSRIESIASLWVGDSSVKRGFMGGIWNGISSEAAAERIDLSVHHVPMNLSDIPVRTFAPAEGQGLIVLGGLVGAYEFALLANQAILSVLVDGTMLGVDCIATDNHEGIRQGLDHLKLLGHRRIAFSGGFCLPGNTTNENERREAFMRLCASMDLEPLILDGGDADLHVESLSTVDAPTAFVFSRDESALNFLNAASSRGYRVPEDISILSFDDYMPEIADRAVTAIRVDREGIGRAAVRHLLSAHLTPTRPMLWTRVAPRLIVRESTGVVA